MKATILIFISAALQISLFGQQSEYIEILKHYPNYSTIEYSIPDFTYQSDKSIETQLFRERFKIDSIAGSGDEFDRQIRILKWVNRSFKHNGHSHLPIRINTDTLVKAGIHEGINCGGLAILLNSAYLSIGYKSRFITCLNNDTTYNDPHSLTMVFSNKFDKWILMDPTYCAYFTDEQGNPLSIEEIRFGLINGQIIKLNDGFYLNSISSSGTIDHYYQYITRNMFRFISPINSKIEFNLNCLGYIHLIPKDFNLNYLPLSQEIQEGCSKVYNIDNQKQFWK